MDSPTEWIIERTRELQNQLSIFSGGWQHELHEHLEVVLARIEHRAPLLTPKYRHDEWVHGQCLPNGEQQETA
jgi:hypothetical protein